MTLPSEAGYILLYIARSPIIRSPSDSYCFPVQSECGKDRRNEEYNISPIQANIFFTLNLDKPHGLVTLVRVICLISRSAKSVLVFDSTNSFKSIARLVTIVKESFIE